MKRIRLIISYIRDKETSLIKKLLILGSVLYLILPFDLVPDFIVGLGWLDDLLVGIFIWLAMKTELEGYNKKKSKIYKRGSKIIDFKKRRDN